jgi:hypothetical protein
VLIELPEGVGGLALLFYFILYYFCNTHQVLVGLSQGVGGLVILIQFNLIYFNLFCLFL